MRMIMAGFVTGDPLNPILPRAVAARANPGALVSVDQPRINPKPDRTDSRTGVGQDIIRFVDLSDPLYGIYYLPYYSASDKTAEIGFPSRTDNRR